MRTKGLIRALVGIEMIITEEVFMETETKVIVIKEVERMKGDAV